MTRAERRQEIDYPDVHDLVAIARAVVPGASIRDIGLLHSAAGRPQATVFGDDAYPTFELKVAALMHSLGRNHTLVDGNKRLAWAAGRIFCLMNGRDLVMDIDDAEALIVGIARGDLEAEQVAQRLQKAIVRSGLRRRR